MGILIAGLVVANLNMPLIPAWASPGVMLLVSLGGLLGMTWFLYHKSVGRSKAS
jgi:hypothetical protein